MEARPLAVVGVASWRSGGGSGSGSGGGSGGGLGAAGSASNGVGKTALVVDDTVPPMLCRGCCAGDVVSPDDKELGRASKEKRLGGRDPRPMG